MISVKPCSLSNSTRNSITGFCRMGIMGLGIVWVMGCTRVPLPAARIIAFMSDLVLRDLNVPSPLRLRVVEPSAAPPRVWGRPPVLPA